MKLEIDGQRIDIRFLDPGDDDDKLREYAHSWAMYDHGLLIQAVIVGATRYARVINVSVATRHVSFNDDGYLGWSEESTLKPLSEAMFVEMFEPSTTAPTCRPALSACRCPHPLRSQPV